MSFPPYVGPSSLLLALWQLKTTPLHLLWVLPVHTREVSEGVWHAAHTVSSHVPDCSPRYFYDGAVGFGKSQLRQQEAGQGCSNGQSFPTCSKSHAITVPAPQTLHSCRDNLFFTQLLSPGFQQNTKSTWPQDLFILPGQILNEQISHNKTRDVKAMQLLQES